MHILQLLESAYGLQGCKWWEDTVEVPYAFFSSFHPECWQKSLWKKVRTLVKRGGMGNGVESLEERLFRTFSLLGTIFCPLVWVVLFHTGYCTLQVDLSLLKHVRVGRMGGRHQVERKIEAIDAEVGGNYKHYCHGRVICPSFLLFCYFFFLFILASVMKQNYTGSQLKGPSCLSDKRAINIAAMVDT